MIEIMLDLMLMMMMVFHKRTTVCDYSLLV